MNKIYVLIFLSCNFVCFSQNETAKDSIFKQNIVEIVEEIKFMFDYDQAIRNYTLYKTFDKSKIDSIQKLNYEITLKFISDNNFKSDSLALKILNNYIIFFDNIHTERLISITKKYGYPSLKRIKKYYSAKLNSELNPYLIFVHSQKKYWSEIESLMKTEYENGNFNKCSYGHFLWHINGRGNVKYMLENGYKYIMNKQGQNVLTAVNCE